MKIIISDFDETFSVNIDDNIKYATEFMNDGNIFVIATGSSYQSYIDKLKGSIFNANYVITNHGSIIVKNGKVIFEKSLSDDLSNSIFEDIMESNYKSYFYCNKDVRMSNKVLDKTVKINIDFNSTKDAIKFREEMLRKYGNYINCYLMYGTLIEIISINASKIIAINKIIELENISKDNVYTIGDGYNDIDMIKQFKGYAMKDSVIELKEVAIKEVDSVYELVKEISK